MEAGNRISWNNSMLRNYLFSLICYCISTLPIGLRAQTIEEATLCENIVSLNPVNPTTAFTKGKRVYCWMRVKDAAPGSSIQVRWFHQGVIQHTTNLKLPYKTMRTYAYKTMHYEGFWEARITKPDGTLLKTLKFIAGEANIGGKFDPHAENPINSELGGSKGEVKAGQEVKSADRKNVIKEKTEVILPKGYDKNKTYAAVVLLPYTDGTAAGLYNWYRRELGEKGVIVLLPGGAGSTDDHTWQGFEAAIQRYEHRVKADLQDFVAKYNIDPKRVYLSGFSLGGDLSWALSMRNPNLFAGALVMGSRCSYPPRGNLSIMAAKGTRFFLVMGEHESDVRLKIFNQSKALLDQAKVSYLYKQVPGGGHVSAPPKMYKEGLEFLLKEN